MSYSIVLFLMSFSQAAVHPQVQDIYALLQSPLAASRLEQIQQSAEIHSPLSRVVKPSLNIAQPGLQRESKVLVHKECQNQVCETMERKFLFHLAQVEWNYRSSARHQIDIIPVEITIQSEIIYINDEKSSEAPTVKKQSLKIIGHRFL